MPQTPARRRVRPPRSPALHAAPASRPPTNLLQNAHLHPVPSTLLIPLAARARGARYFPWLDCRDAVAGALLQRLGADVAALLDDLPTVFQVLWRTRAVKDAGHAFFAEYPQALGANLGCGLTQHFQWLDGGANQWLDADLPEVMALRRPLLPAHGPRARQAEVDLTQPGWWKRLALPSRRGAPPVLLVCEGVLMYLQPDQVQAVLAEFAQCAPPGSRMVLERWEKYFKAGKPYADKVVISPMGEAASRDIAFRNKEIDVSILGPTQYVAYRADPNLSKGIFEVAEVFTRNMGMNPAFKPFSDKRVRQAINHAIDSDLIIKRLVRDKAYRASSWLPLSSPAFNKETKPYAFDPEKARKLLAEAGYPDGFEFEWTATPNESCSVKLPSRST